MSCNYNLKEYDAIVLLMIDLDREKIIYPITTDNAVIITSLENSPITLTEYLSTIKLYTSTSLELYDRSIIGETPEGKAYKATDGILLEENLEELLQNLDNFKDEINSLGLYNYNIRLNNLYNNFTTLLNSVNYLQDIVSNIKYEYEIILFKVTQTNDTPEEPKPIGDGYFSDNWDISYNSSLVENNYIWMATSIITVKNGNISYSPWKVMLLYSNGLYVGESSKYEKSIYYITSEYRKNLAKPTGNYLNEGWTNYPTGISMLYPYEYISTRYYSLDGNPLGEWSNPVLWSRWGSIGGDSSDIEYIYCAINLNSNLENWPFANNDDKSPNSWDPNTVLFLEQGYIKENLKLLWYNNPVNLTTGNPYQFVSIRKRHYQKETDSYIWLGYTKPVLWSSLGKNGDGTGTLGLMGPVVRFKGLYNDSKTYVNMINDTSLGVNDIRYVDVVKYNNYYYMVLPEESITREVKNKVPVNYPNDWQKVEDFEFIATDVLLDIDYLASNEVVIFDKDPKKEEDANIVSGMIGGDSEIVKDSNSSTNPVRIWSGTSTRINKDDSGNYLETEVDLELAPFKVREDGTLVSNKAEIYTELLSLVDNKTFWYNQSTINLPTFTLNEHKVIYILLDNSNSCVLNVNNNNYRICNLENNIWNIYLNSLTLSNNCLYTLVSNYDQNNGLYKWYILGSNVITLENSQEIYNVILHFSDIIYPIETNTIKIIPDFKCYLSSPSNSLPSNYHSTILATLHPYAANDLLTNTQEIYLKDSDYFYIVLPKYCCARLYKRLGDDSYWSNNSSEVKDFIDLHKDPSKIGIDKVFEVNITQDMPNDLLNNTWQEYWSKFDNYYHYVNKKQDGSTGNDYYVYRGTDNDCYYEKNIECFYSISGEFIEVDLDELEPGDYEKIYPLNTTYTNTYILELYNGDNIPTRPKNLDLVLSRLRYFYKNIAGADVKIYRIKISGNRYNDHFCVPKGETLSRELHINIDCMRRDDTFPEWHVASPMKCLSSVLYGSAMNFMINYADNHAVLKKIIKYLHPNMEDSDIDAYLLNLWDILPWIEYLYFITSNTQETPYKIEILPQWKEDIISILDMNGSEYTNFKTKFRDKYEQSISVYNVSPIEGIPPLDIKHDLINGLYGNICGFISESHYPNQPFLHIFDNPLWAKSLDPDWDDDIANNQNLKSPCNITIIK